MSSSRKSEAPATNQAPDGEASLEAAVPEALLELESENAAGPALTCIATELLPFLDCYIARNWSGLQDGEFIAGEALATVLARLHTYKPEHGSLKGWAAGIARHKALAAFREQTAGRAEEETKYAENHRKRFHLKSRPDEALHDTLLQAILSFPEADHYLLHLIMVERQSIADAARILKITPALARKKKERLLKALESITNTPPREA